MYSIDGLCELPHSPPSPVKFLELALDMGMGGWLWSDEGGVVCGWRMWRDVVVDHLEEGMAILVYGVMTTLSWPGGSGTYVWCTRICASLDHSAGDLEGQRCDQRLRVGRGLKK